MIAFATGGLLGDVFLHLVPHSFFGEGHDDGHHRAVVVEEKRNVVIGSVSQGVIIHSRAYKQWSYFCRLCGILCSRQNNEGIERSSWRRRPFTLALSLSFPLSWKYRQDNWCRGFRHFNSQIPQGLGRKGYTGSNRGETRDQPFAQTFRLFELVWRLHAQHHRWSSYGC